MHNKMKATAVGGSDNHTLRSDSPERKPFALPIDSMRRQWLVRRKVIIPDQPATVLDRPSLVRRCQLTRYGVTALMAPAGFGKTVLLAECCRRAREDGALVAWVTVDERDDADTLFSYLAMAFVESGGELEFNEPESNRYPGRQRLGALLQWIETIDGEVVIAMDELERLEEESVAMVDYMVRRGPPNLHLALAFRTRPRGLDIATPILEGRGMVVTAEHLRFQKPDLARYFGGELSLDKLRSLWEETQGWPLAVCLPRNVADRLGDTGMVGDFTQNWVETRLLGGLSPNDRQFVLEVGLFEWGDAELLDRVLKRGSMRRLRLLKVLRGLIQQVGDGSFRLHALLRQYAADELRQSDPHRFRSVHRRIALVLAERGQIVEAIHHACEADEVRLAGRILDHAGGIRIGIRDGIDRFQRAVRLIPPEAMRSTPRLELVQCSLLAMNENVGDARRQYMGIIQRLHSAKQQGDGGRNRELEIDLIVFQGIMALCGCVSAGSPEVQMLIAQLEELAQDETEDPLVQGLAQFGTALFAYQSADFAKASAFAARAKSYAKSTSTHITMCVDYILAEIEFARGEAAEARNILLRASRVAKRDFAYDPRPIGVGQVLLAELNLEQHRTDSVRHLAHSATELSKASAWMDVFVAFTTVAVDLAAHTEPAQSLAPIDNGLEFARQTQRPGLARCLAALKASSLIRMGRLKQAGDLWARADLPTDVNQCVDMEGQSWREMECIGTARVQYLAASGQCEAARHLAKEFASVARKRNLVRSLTYANAATIYAAWCADDSGGAREQMLENLALFDRTGYCRAMLWHPLSTQWALRSLGDSFDSRLTAARQELLAKVALIDESNTVPDFSERELEILARLELASDKEIGRELGLSNNGVRYHLKKIYRKLGARNRVSAVSRARMLGVLPPPPPAQVG